MLAIALIAIPSALLLTIPMPSGAQDTTIDRVSLSGTITDPDGRPVESVHVYAARSAASGRTQTSADGSYSIDLSPGVYEVSISPPVGSEWIRTTIEEVVVDEDATLDVVLETGPMLTLHILDPEGNTVDDPDVTIEGGGFSLGWSCSGCVGPFRMALAPGRYEITIRPPPGVELLETTIHVDIDGDVTRDVVLKQGLFYPVSGHVLDTDGNPVSGASMHAWSFLLPYERGEGTTSSDGSYSMPLKPGTYWVSARPPDGIDLATRAVNVRVAGYTDLDIVLEPGVVLTGQVAGPDGEPETQVSISARRMPEAYQAAFTSVAEDGTYRMIVERGTYTLEIDPWEEDGFLEQRISDVEITGDMTFDVALGTGSTLSGIVTDPEGAPIPGAMVSVWNSDGLWSMESAVTAEDGGYRIDGLRPDSYTVSVGPPDDSQLSSEVVKDVAVGEDRVLDIELGPGLVIAGRITDVDGDPVAGIYVWAMGPALAAGSTAVTGADGSYRLTVMPGQHTLTLAQVDEGGFAARATHYVEVSEDMTLDLTLERAEVSALLGRVTDSEGAAVAGVSVAASSRDASWLTNALNSTETESDGTYQLMLEAGRYDLTCAHYVGDDGVSAGRKVFDTDVTDDTVFDIELPSLDATWEVRGIVRDREGNPMAEVQVSAVDRSTGSYSTTITRPAGEYLLLLPPGIYEFTLNSGLVEGSQFGKQSFEGVVVEGFTINNMTVDYSRVTAVEVEQARLPHAFALEQNYPNPFNSDTSIRFELPARGEVELLIFNLIGQRVATLVEGSRDAGMHTARWDGRDDDGRAVASGIYLYKLLTRAGEAETRKLVLVR